uniref:Uncharacterized protein n=1 Tax=Arundo donax TaxID=35708 RepID=A0A0A9G011_ARUDO
MIFIPICYWFLLPFEYCQHVLSRVSNQNVPKG